MSVLLLNISSLVTVNSRDKGFKSGMEMQEIEEIKNGALYFDEKIQWCCTTDEARIMLSNNKIKPETILNMAGKTVMPGFVDSHTHIVFAGNRSQEFGKRLRGATYQQIAVEGGGIQTTVKATREATLEQLFENGKSLALSALNYGTTSLEIKSGYSLNVEGEIKQLQAIKMLKEQLPMNISSTFLGAHDFPDEYKDKRNDYVELICKEMIPRIVEQNLAEFCDVFVDEGFYTVEQGEKILTSAAENGLKLKVHADELADKSAGALAAKMNAVSADHLLFVNDVSLDLMNAAGTVAALLPGTAYFIRMPYANARKMIQKGLIVALATDTNPGSCFTENMQMIMSLASINMNMTAEESICASTINGAKALMIQQTKGSLEKGKDADFVVYNCDSYIDIVYHFGINHVKEVWIKGVKVV
jgi:imidazolonepropionase